MDEFLLKRHYRLSREQIGYLRFLLESYDGLAFVRTLDPRAALVEVAYPPSRRRDAEDLLDALAVELSLTKVPAPSPGLYPAL